MKYTELLAKKEKIQCPSWMVDNVMFEGMTGSVAYAVSNDTSDMDIIGFYIPQKEVIFPHLAGEIPGFGTPRNRLESFTAHHIELPEQRKEIDLTLYSIVKFFQLCMENNPNMVDVLYLPRRCVLHSTAIYEHIRENRKMFLHKGAWHKFRGYSFSQMTKIDKGTNRANPKRQDSINEHGFDTKFAYHIIRLILEVEQILVHHDLDLECNGSFLRAIRDGEWSLDQIKEWFSQKEKDLEKVYHSSSLQYKANENQIKKLLLECLEMHYGSLSTTLNMDINANILIDIQAVIDKYKGN